MNETTKKTRARKAPTGKVRKSPSSVLYHEKDGITESANAESISVEAATVDIHAQNPAIDETDASVSHVESEASTLLPIVLTEKFSSDDSEVDKLASRLKELNKDIAWLLVGAGIAGIILPGVLGTPFFVVGVIALLPGSADRIERWRKKYAKSAGFNLAFKQINRFLDDLDKRYPKRLH